MKRLRVAPIVEGHGEVQAVRLLLRRVWTELLPGDYVDVLQPIRQPRHRIVQREGLERAVQLAIAKLAQANSGEPVEGSLLLILVDADEDLPCVLGPQILALARHCAGTHDTSCVMANVEYETWFVAAAESLRDYLTLLPTDEMTTPPEQLRLRKAWVQSRFKGTRYSETRDQPAMTAAMDLALCRRRSPSFDKLCREFEKRLVL